MLAARRSQRTGFAGYWEFPGGKVEPGEEPRAALVREIVEELSATIVVGDEIGDVPWVISETLELRLFLASLAGDDPQRGADHDELRWLAPDDFDSLDWLPSDLLALETVRHAVCTPT